MLTRKWRHNTLPEIYGGAFAATWPSAGRFGVNMPVARGKRFLALDGEGSGNARVYRLSSRWALVRREVNLLRLRHVGFLRAVLRR